MASSRWFSFGFPLQSLGELRAKLVCLPLVPPKTKEKENEKSSDFPFDFSLKPTKRATHFGWIRPHLKKEFAALAGLDLLCGCGLAAGPLRLCRLEASLALASVGVSLPELHFLGLDHFSRGTFHVHSESRDPSFQKSSGHLGRTAGCWKNDG